MNQYVKFHKNIIILHNKIINILSNMILLFGALYIIMLIKLDGRKILYMIEMSFWSVRLPFILNLHF